MHEGPLPVKALLTCWFKQGWKYVPGRPQGAVVVLPHEKSEEVEPVTDSPAVKVDRKDDAESPYLRVYGTDHERVRKVFTEQLAGFKLQHNLP